MVSQEKKVCFFHRQGFNMQRTIEVIYEDSVLKPIIPIEGLQEHERVLVILCPRTNKDELRKLAGTLSHEEAESMRKLIDEEFEKIEGE
jgi:predicted DNA-binding antitoxin AbrB/MazE fold protein